MPTDRDALRQWNEIVSALHLQCAPDSNHDSFEMGMIVGTLLTPTHGKLLQQGARERLRGVGVDAGKLNALARSAMQQARPQAPPTLRIVPKERSHAAWMQAQREDAQGIRHAAGCLCERCAIVDGELAEAYRNKPVVLTVEADSDGEAAFRAVGTTYAEVRRQMEANDA